MSAGPLQHWLDAAGRYPLLRKDEELMLSRLVRQAQSPEATPAQIKAGRRAHDRMFRANTRLVFSTARKFFHRIRANSGLTPEDLLQEGCIGLNRAIELFDSERGYAFSTYATLWIQQAVRRVLEQNNNGPIRLPVCITQLLNKARNAPAHVRTREQMLDYLQVSEKQLAHAEASLQRSYTVSLEVQLGSEESLTLGDAVADPRSEPMLILDQQLAWEAIEAALAPEHLELLQRNELGGEKLLGLAEERGQTRIELVRELAEAKEQAAERLRDFAAA